MKRLLTALLSMVVAGCSSAGQPSISAPLSTPSQSVTSAPASEAASPSANQGTLGTIKSAGTVNILMDATYQPWESIDPSGKFVGLDVDLSNRLFGADLGLKVNFTNITFSGLLLALSDMKGDLIMSAVGVNAQRELKYDFSIPYYGANHAVMVQANSTIASPEDLSGKQIGAQISTTHQATAQAYEQSQFIAKGQPGFKGITTYDTLPVAVQSLISGRLDAIVDDGETLQTVIDQKPGQFKIVGSIGQPLWLSAVVRKGDSALLAFINDEIRKLKTDGSLAQLQQKWLNLQDASTLPDPLPSDIP